MLLAIDVGNTNTNFAVFEDKEIKVHFSLTTKVQRTSDEFALTIKNLLEMNRLSFNDISGSIISSVVPAVMHSLINCIRKYMNHTPMQVTSGIKTGIRITCANPKEIGADRIVDLAAAYELYGGPLMLIDFATATTYDLINEEGTFCVGITCPGMQIAANALWSETARLPEIEIVLPSTILAKDTVGSMQAGLVYGCIGQTEYIIRRVREEAGLTSMKVVATGGFGRIITDATDMIDVYDGQLTLRGLEMIYRRNRKNDNR